jgi:hypothetical protein
LHSFSYSHILFVEISAGQGCSLKHFCGWHSLQQAKRFKSFKTATHTHNRSVISRHGVEGFEKLLLVKQHVAKGWFG